MPDKKLDGIFPFIADPSQRNSTNSQNPPIQQNLRNFYTTDKILI